MEEYEKLHRGIDRKRYKSLMELNARSSKICRVSLTGLTEHYVQQDVITN